MFTLAAGAAMGLVRYDGSGGRGGGTTDLDLTDRADRPAVPRGDRPQDSGPEAARDAPHGRPEHGDPATAPRRSGHGRRVVYDISDQRVWLIGADNKVRRSYLVSGSVTDNLRPGAYRVYSRSRHAVGFDEKSTMDFMVRFTRGKHASIGFHAIPVDLAGRPLQTVAQLGTPRSHGCIRQRPTDARAMWRFAGIGTAVRVLA